MRPQSEHCKLVPGYVSADCHIQQFAGARGYNRKTLLAFFKNTDTVCYKEWVEANKQYFTKYGPRIILYGFEGARNHECILVAVVGTRPLEYWSYRLPKYNGKNIRTIIVNGGKTRGTF